MPRAVVPLVREGGRGHAAIISRVHATVPLSAGAARPHNAWGTP